MAQTAQLLPAKKILKFVCQCRGLEDIG